MTICDLLNRPEMEVEILDEVVELMPQKALWLKNRNTVLLADLHFGKINHFRKSGIPVPPKANDKKYRSAHFSFANYQS
jgi:metallophosphoesterase superfamily enzyme